MAEGESQTPLRALIVDDHPIIVSALVASLNSLGTFTAIDQETSLADALECLAGDVLYDIVILDLNLGDANGAETIVRVREQYPDLPLVIFSADESRETIVAAFEQGVHGYVPKSYSMPQFLNAIRTVLAGSVFVPPELVALMGFKLPSPELQPKAPSGPALNLSPRQAQVFEYLLQGLPNKVIASRLGMAEGTVKTHLNTIYRLLGVNSRTQVILKARELGVI